MTEYFPGSVQPITGVSRGKDILQGEVGKTFTIGGKEIELLTITQAAKCLNRTPGALRKWERTGIIPQATFVKPGTGGDIRGKRRLYSRQQVEAMVTIADEEGILYNLKAQISKTQFAAKVLRAFKDLAGAR